MELVATSVWARKANRHIKPWFDATLVAERPVGPLGDALGEQGALFAPLHLRDVYCMQHPFSKANDKIRRDEKELAPRCTLYEHSHPITLQIRGYNLFCWNVGVLQLIDFAVNGEHALAICTRYVEIR